MNQPLQNGSSSEGDHDHDHDHDHDVLDSSASHDVAYSDPASDDDSDDGDEGMTLAQLVEHRRTQRELQARRGYTARQPSFPTSTAENGVSFAATPTLPPKKAPASSSSKSKPRELSCKRPVPVGRNMCLGPQQRHQQEQRQRSLKNFDPRFEQHCGDLDDMHVERNYHFLAQQREARRQQLRDKLERLEQSTSQKQKQKEKQAHTTSRKMDAIKSQLNRIEQGDLRRSRVQRQREVSKQVKDEQKQAVREGKNPFFLKRNELKQRQLKMHFDELKKSRGGVTKFIAKRRRKLVGKERKHMARPSEQ